MSRQDSALHDCREIAGRELSSDGDTCMDDLHAMAEAFSVLDVEIMRGERLPLAWLDCDVEFRRIAKQADGVGRESVLRARVSELEVALRGLLKTSIDRRLMGASPPRRIVNANDHAIEVARALLAQSQPAPTTGRGEG